MSKGWLAEVMGAGAGWLDYDGDGKLDLYLVNGSAFDRKPDEGEPNRLFRGNGKGTFTEVTKKAGVGHRGWGYGVAVGDIDNDGDPDMYVTNNGPNVLYRNDGDGSFSDVTTQAGVGDSRWGTSAAFFDMDGDGDLDLYVANYMEGDSTKVPRRDSEKARAGNCVYRGLQVFCGPRGQTPVQDVMYRNDGNFKFTDVTDAAGLLLDKPRYSLGVVTGDYNNDGKQDIYVANDSVRNSLWKNLGDGKFKDVGVSTMSALNADGKPQAGMGTSFGDYNNDGWLDLIVTNFARDLNTLYRNLSGKFFSDDSMLAGLGVTDMALSWGTGFQDFDHDGDVDLFIANGHIYPQIDAHNLGSRYHQQNHFFVNSGNGRFVESSDGAGPGLALKRSFRGVAFADYDEDGDVDLLVTTVDDEAVLLRNARSGAEHYLKIRLIGNRSNRDGVGARVIVNAGGRRQIRERIGGGSYLSSSDPRLHFGLNDSGTAERIEVRWPSGTVDVLTDVEVDRTITIEEGSHTP